MLSLSLNASLLPKFVDRLPPGNTLSHLQRRDRWLVPILDRLPRLDMLATVHHASALRLFWLVMLELTARAPELEACEGVLVPAPRWQRLAGEAGLPLADLPRVLGAWCEDCDLAPAFLVRLDRDLWTLGPAHRAAVNFIVARCELARERARKAARDG